MIDCHEHTIHIVDDSKLILVALTNTLKPQGYNVTYSMNGQDAIESIQKNRPSLIVLDVEMPIMDGYETIKKLKSNNETLNIPVIFHTTLTQPEVIKQLFQLGASDYIAKPFIAEELLERIAKEIKNINLQNQLKDKMSKLADVISRDTLTRSYNRIYITSVINRRMHMIERKNEDIFSLMYVDIDNFNKFNTLNGFVQSDRALQRFSKVLQSSLRENDILSRWEGDKFIVLLPHLTNKSLQLIAEKIMLNISKTAFSPTIGLSCSIAMIKVSMAEDISELLKKLKNKMKEIKQIKKGSISMIERL